MSYVALFVLSVCATALLDAAGADEIMGMEFTAIHYFFVTLLVLVPSFILRVSESFDKDSGGNSGSSNWRPYQSTYGGTNGSSNSATIQVVALGGDSSPTGSGSGCGGGGCDGGGGGGD